jgi:hypothetical protein
VRKLTDVDVRVPHHHGERLPPAEPLEREQTGDAVRCPTTTTTTVIGYTAFKTRTEAENSMKTTKVCSSD